MAEAENPTVIARETLKLLATRRMAPTPRNYMRTYQEIAGGNVTDASPGEKFAAMVKQQAARNPDEPVLRSLQWAFDQNSTEALTAALQGLTARPDRGAAASESSATFREALRQLDLPHRGWTPGRKRESLDRVLASGGGDAQIVTRLAALLRAWQDSGAAPAADSDALPAGLPDPVSGRAPDRAVGVTLRDGARPAAVTRDPSLEEARELLAASLETALAPRIERYSDVYSELFQIAWRVREAESADDWSRLGQQLRQFWRKVELRAEPDEELLTNLMRLIGLLVDNIDELVEDEQWVHGQMALLRELVSKPVDLRAVREAERGFKEVIFKQSHLKAGLADAKKSLKSLLSVFVERLADVTGHTVEFHGKIGKYAERIASTESMDSLKTLVDELMSDTRGMQVDMMRSRDELMSARGQAEQAEQRVRQLEGELERVSEQVREDHLTGTLNRRGMNDAMQREIARAGRTGKPMCVSMLDLDNFKKLNDTHGHAAGDAALVHLAKVIRHTVRPTDVIARYGGEEFVIILTDTDLDTAVSITVRLQRELTKRFFLHNNERLLVTFSAGVAQIRKGEEEEQLVQRADQAMYQAKVQGKNQVVRAD
jgi:diguanylate cyclase